MRNSVPLSVVLTHAPCYSVERSGNPKVVKLGSSTVEMYDSAGRVETVVVGRLIESESPRYPWRGDSLCGSDSGMCGDRLKVRYLSARVGVHGRHTVG